jgi:hypothetical protein
LQDQNRLSVIGKDQGEKPMPKMRLQIALVAVFVFYLPVVELAAQNPIPLPIRKVVLYKNGMGYFEHLGTVRGPQSVEILLPSAQLNDVLKSLTVLDLGGGRIAGVNYDSAAPLDRRLAELPIDLDSTVGLVGFLNKIRGAGVEIRAPGGTVTGKLMGAELRTKSTDSGATWQEIQASVFTPEGVIQIVELESAGELKLTEPALAGDIGSYLDLLGTTHQRDIRRLRINTLGKGERQMYISYTSESPIWKATYRIVLEPKQKPLLQGWAVVDNTTPMDWRDVSLSLAAGAPISFIQDLSQPIYAQRPVVPVAQGIQVKPEAYEAKIEGERDQMNKVAGLAARAGASRLMMEEAPSAKPAAAPAPGSVSDAMRQQILETAQARAVGEQFEYQIGQPVTIERNQSALLPIIQEDVDGEKVSVYRASGDERHPRLAFWLKNISGLTLDAGPVTVIDSNAFAGEGLIESVQPGESRLLSYAVDLGTEVSTTTGSERQRVERVQINRGILHMYAKTVEKKTYKIRNNNDSARTIVLEHPVRSGWKLISANPEETSANYYRFQISLNPSSTKEYTVQEEAPLESSFSVSSITPEQIVLWVRERSIDPEIEKALQIIAKKKSEVSDLAQKTGALDRERDDIFKDQARVRDNLQRLRQTPEEATLRQRYIRQLDSQENRLETIRKEREKLEASRAAAQKQLDELIEKLSLDKKI